MKKFNFFQLFYLSFFSRAAYKDVAHNWRGTGFAYLLVLLIVFWVPASFLIGLSINTFVKEQVPLFVKQVPTIHVVAGVLSVDKSTPCFIKDPKTGHDLAIIDTSGKYTSLDNTQALLLVTKSHVLYKKNAEETRIFSMNNVKSATITQDTLFALVSTIRMWILVLLFPVLLAGAFIYRAIVALLLAIVGNVVVKRIVHAPLQFEQVLRISIVAMTPAYVVSVLLDVLSVAVPFAGLICGALALGYLIFALRANRPA